MSKHSNHSHSPAVNHHDHASLVEASVQHVHDRIEAIDPALQPAVRSSEHAVAPLTAIVVHNRWWVAGVALLLAGATIPWVWALLEPEYAASAQIRVAPVLSRVVYRTEENDIIPYYQAFLHTQVAIIRSPAVLNRVLDRRDVRETQWYQGEPDQMPLVAGPVTPMERLRQNLLVEPMRNTEMIDVTMTTKNPKDSVVIVDAIVQEYERYNLELEQQSGNQVMAKVQSEEADAKRQIDNLRELKFKVAEALGTLSPEALGSQKVVHLSELQARHQDLKREGEILQWQLSNMPEAPEAGMPADKLALMDPEWRELQRRRDDLAHELSKARERFGENHPQVVALTSDVEHATQQLQIREQQLSSRLQLPNPAAEVASNPSEPFLDRAGLEMLIARKQRELELLEKDIQDQTAEVTRVARLAQDLAKKEEEESRLRQFHQELANRLQVLDLESQAPARISVASTAVASSEPYRDPRGKLTALLLGFSMMSGIGVAYARWRLNPKIYEAADVRQSSRMPFLGQLPPLPKRLDLGGPCDPALAESVRMVRTALLKRIEATDTRVVLVSSSTSGTGKTTVAALLSRSLAQLGKRVLLVEGDLRCPALSKRVVGFESQFGLGALLTGQVDESQVILKTHTPPIDVIVAGNIPADFNFELLANGALQQHLKRWRKKYDIVLIDGPPILPVADAPILAGEADGTILVLRSDYCRRDDVVRAFSDLRAAGASLLGTVFIGSPHAKSYYQRYETPRNGGIFSPAPVFESDHKELV